MSVICPFQFSQYYLPIFNFPSIICKFSIFQVLFAYFQFRQYCLSIRNFLSIICMFNSISIFPVLFAYFFIFQYYLPIFNFPQYYLPIFNFPSIICLTELSSANLVSNSFEFLQHLKCAKFALSSFSWFSSTRSTWFHKIWPRYTRYTSASYIRYTLGPIFGSDVCYSLTGRGCWNLTDVTLVVGDTNSILAVDRATPGDVAMQVAPPGGQI